MKKAEFTLRKGIIIKVVSSNAYIAKDTLTLKEIKVTISGKEHQNGLIFTIGDTIYIIVVSCDLSRGRFYSKQSARGHQVNFKSLIKLLDNGIDPLSNTNDKR